jgi:hypothetical protein
MRNEGMMGMEIMGNETMGHLFCSSNFSIGDRREDTKDDLKHEK